MGDVTTIVLRFRDLVNDIGETISEHKLIIEKNKYVWWGWWKKGSEITPIDIFSRLSIRAKENQIEIYLLDSGREKLYKAKCCDIECTENQKRMSPDNTITPEYYKNNSYYAWFKFCSIEECDSEEIRKFSYSSSDNLFKDGETNYNLFFNKRIFNLAELVQQNRTVWFLRLFDQKNDKDNEIVLLNANILQPYIFGNKYKELKGDTFLWLSDLHFTNGVLSNSKMVNKQSLLSHIKLCCKENFNDIVSLILSGDITDCGKKEGFNMAYDFIKDINRESVCRLDSDNIVVCPGNHDLKRKECIHPKNEEAKLLDISDAVEFSTFFEKIYNIKPNEFLASGRKFITQSGQMVEIVAINTIMLQQYTDFEGHGFITQEQLDYIEKSMNWNMKKSRSNYRIVVMHHHYCPVCFSEKVNMEQASSVVYDADRLMKWLVKNNVNLLLHGHKHNKFIAQISTPIERNNTKIDMNQMHNVNIISAGGIGAKNTDNRFATLTFNPQEICVRIYKIHPDNSSEDVMEQTISIPLK